MKGHIDRWHADNGVKVTSRYQTLKVDDLELDAAQVKALREYFAHDADPRSRDFCRCHVYRYVHDMGLMDHPFRRVRGLRLWLMDHEPIRHVRAWVWWHVTTEKCRWRAAERLHKRRPELCWCQMVDCILLQGAPSDYEDLCEVPLLRDVQPYEVGRCYCRPDEMTYESDPETSPQPTSLES